MHTTHAPKKPNMTIKLSGKLSRRIPIAGKGQSTRFGNWRKDARTTSKVKVSREE
jgi:hypothetical protein